MATFFNADMTITDGKIDNAVIGGLTPATGTFTTGTFNTSVITDLIDGLTNSTLNIGGTTSSDVSLGKNAAQTRVQGYLDVVNYLTVNSIDARAAMPLIIGSTAATAIQIADNGVLSTLSGPVQVFNSIDTTSGVPMVLGNTNATGLLLGSATTNTTMLGKTIVKQGAAGANTGIDTAIAGTLAIGGQTANAITLGKSDTDTTILGKAVVQPGAAGTNVGIDTQSAGILAIGGQTANALQLGSATVDTTVLGKTVVRQGVAGANVGVDTATAGALSVGGQTATSVRLGSTTVDTLTLGALLARPGAAAANIGIDTASAGILTIGGITATELQLGSSTVDTKVLGQTIVRSGAAGANIGIDVTGGNLDIGGTNATSVTLANTAAATTVGGHLRVQPGVTATKGIDVASAGALAFGQTTATSLQLGSATADTTVAAKLLIKQGVAGANVGIDTTAAGILAFGGQTATSIELGSTSINTSTLGGLRVRAGTGANAGIDTASAGFLRIGETNATSLSLSKTGDTTTVQGSLTVNQNTLLQGNLTVNGTMTTVNTQDISIADSCITLNAGYIAEPAHAGCITIITDPAPSVAQTTVAATGFTAAGGGLGPRVFATANPFTQGQIVQITGANNDANNGLFQFNQASGAGPFALEFYSTVDGTAPTTGVEFVQNDFITDTVVAGILTLVGVSIIHVSGAGQWGTAVGNTGSAFATYRNLLGSTSNASTDNAIARWNGATGSLIQDSSIMVADTTGVLNFTSSSGNIQVAGVDVFPTSAIVNTLPRFSSTTGRALTTTGVTVDASNNMSGINNLSAVGSITLGGTNKTVQLSALGAVAATSANVLTNATYNSNAPVSGGLTVIYDPTTVQNSVAGAAFSSTSTIVTDNANSFAVGDIIQIVNASNPDNNGIFEVASYASSTITIDTTPVESFSKNAFVADSTVSGTITKVAVSNIRAATTGQWQTGFGSVAPLSYTDLSSGLTGGGVTDRVVVWSSATNVTNRNVVIDSNSNLDMQSASARHIVQSSEALTIGASGNVNPSADKDITFVTVSDNTPCTGTIPAASFVGQTHMIVISAVGGISSRYDLTVANYQPASGAAGAYTLRFTKAGQSALMVWNGTNYLNANAGATVV
jgi:hypothetical protein